MATNMTLVFIDRNLVPNSTVATLLLSNELERSILNVIPGSVFAGLVKKKETFLFLFLMDFFENSNNNADLPLLSRTNKQRC